MRGDEEICERENEKFSLIINIINCMSSFFFFFFFFFDK